MLLETAQAIKHLNGVMLDGRLLRASYGTSKYCTFFLNKVCMCLLMYVCLCLCLCLCLKDSHLQSSNLLFELCICGGNQNRARKFVEKKSSKSTEMFCGENQNIFI